MSNTENPEWLTAQEASAFLATIGHRVAPATLGCLRHKGLGPVHYRHGGSQIRYLRCDLTTWAQGRVSPPITPAHKHAA